ncbi:acyltransferase family protein [Gelidibacter mesophilus]|uniref:acyltransferase family protein n=1 Tax=Gelidibacter mesophilus TaxID=169050 RepID=UPI0003FBC887|nr:acyltransferase [Gelidibacter mesophilus]
MRKERNFGLDLVRAIAIALVVLSHATFLFVRESDNLVVILMRTMGAVGVDLFFVLSGFLIGGILLKEIDKGHTKFQNLVIFWKRRWWRTLPNYFLVLLINIGVFYVFSIDLPESTGSYFVFLQNFSTPQSYFFTESWSLSIEEYAYLILPFVMFCGFFIFKNRSHSVFLWATLVVIFIGFLVKLHFYMYVENVNHKNWSGMFRKVVIYRLDAIYLGFLLVYIMRHWPTIFQKLKIELLFLGAIVFAGMHLLIYTMDLQPETHLFFYVFMYLPLISISCALAFPFAVSMKRSTTFNPLIYFVSTRSYAIYLINFSIILLSIRYIVDISGAALLLKITLCIVFLLLTLSLSNLLYIYFEKPILNYRDRNLR